MRLDQALVKQKLCESRQEAQELISLGCVLVDGVIVTKQTKQVSEKAILQVTRNRFFVSRGGEKLEGALIHVFGNKEDSMRQIEGKRAIDIGSSTGGFTDCLLQYGARSIVAVDVGTNQLHSKLRGIPKIELLENTDIRTYESKEKFDIIVADLSFITLEKVIDVITSFSKKGTLFFLLIKPQFEVGKGNTKKGIVKDENLTQKILEKYTVLADEKGIKNASIFPCSIKGGEGNQEFFLYGENV